MKRKLLQRRRSRRMALGVTFKEMASLGARPAKTNSILELKIGKACLWFRHFPFTFRRLSGPTGDRSPSSQSCSSAKASHAASILLNRLYAGLPAAVSAIRMQFSAFCRYRSDCFMGSCLSPSARSRPGDGCFGPALAFEARNEIGSNQYPLCPKANRLPAQ
jgi:hypothetical protein